MDRAHISVQCNEAAFVSLSSVHKSCIGACLHPFDRLAVPKRTSLLVASTVVVKVPLAASSELKLVPELALLHDP
jgi:hypothetical protein